MGPSNEEINFTAPNDDGLSDREKCEDRIDEEIERRRLAMQETLKEPTPINEEISDEEKRTRANEIAIDLIVTSREPELKRQSDEARARFVEAAIAQFDERGWVLPKNIHQLLKDDATDHDKERAKMLKILARESKKGTDLM